MLTFCFCQKLTWFFKNSNPLPARIGLKMTRQIDSSGDVAVTVNANLI